MPNPISAEMRRALYDEETDEVFATLVTIDHADLEPPLRATDNEEEIESDGETFVPYAFELAWPTDHENRPPLARLRIGNVDRVIVQTLRALDSPPTVTVQLVRAADPDLVEAELPEFELFQADYDVVVVEGELGLESFLNEPCPHQRFTASSHPGLFP